MQDYRYRGNGRSLCHSDISQSSRYLFQRDASHGPQGTPMIRCFE